MRKSVLIAVAASLVVGSVHAQQYVISTLAGGPLSTPVAARAVSIYPPAGITTNSKGDVFFTSNNCVFKLDGAGVLTLLAGNSKPGYSGDGGPALLAQLNRPSSIAVDKSGNLFIADVVNIRIRRISPDGVITTVAGNGGVDFSEPPMDGGPAASTPLRTIESIAIDSQGNLYIAEYYNDISSGRIRRVGANGIIGTFAGGGHDSPGDGGPATSALLSDPAGISTDATGNLFIADSIDNRVRKVDVNGIITTVAGSGVSGFSGDGQQALQAKLYAPSGVAVDSLGNLFIADLANHRIREVSTTGVISTVAGGGSGFPGDGMPATKVNFCGDSLSLSGLSTDGNGNLYIAACWIQKVSTDGILSIIAGNGTYSFGGDGGPATGAQFFGPMDVAVDQDGNLFIADAGNNLVRKVGTDGNITTFVGNNDSGYHGDGGPATATSLSSPNAVALDSSGNLFIADSGNNRIRKVSKDGIITTVAGTGVVGSSGDGGLAVQARINYPRGIAVDPAGNLFIADANECRVRKVSSDGIITTVAGDGSFGFSGDGGPASAAQLAAPWAVAADAQGNLFIADTVNDRIRKISQDGTISTVAGSGVPGPSGDGGRATDARIFSPRGVAVDGSGTLFVAESYGVRKISASGIITTIAPSNLFESSGDGGPASLAALRPIKLTVDSSGRVYVADGWERTGDGSVRVLTPKNETVLIGWVWDSATRMFAPIAPGKIAVIRGVNLGPTQLIRNQPDQNGVFPSELAGTQVFFDGIAARVLYTSNTEVGAVAPYGIAGAMTRVTVDYQGQTSSPYGLPIALSSPGIFSLSGTGSGQAAAINADGSGNDAAHPIKRGQFLSLYATGEGLTLPTGQDGRIAATAQPLPHPILPVRVSIGGQNATIAYAGAAPGEVAGVMQIVVQVPASVQSGGYVPVAIQVGGSSTVAGAAWIAVSSDPPDC